MNKLEETTQGQTLEDVTDSLEVLGGDLNIQDPILRRKAVIKRINAILSELTEPPKQ